MSRTFPKEIAEATGLHPNTIRSLVDKGLLDAEIDYNGWRWFSNPDKTIRKVKELLYGQPKTVSAVELEKRDESPC